MLGEYKLNEIYNEDCYEAIKKIPDKSVDCIYTDVPYLMQSGGKGGGAFGDRVHKLIRKDMKNIIEGFDYSILNEFVRISKKLNLFIWCNKQQLHDIIHYFKDYSLEILVWGKENPTPFTNNVWLSDLEYCLYFRDKGVKLNDGYDYKSKWYVSPINKADKDLYDHPTIKPLELVKRHLLHATQPGGVIMDCFLGSGTTAVACQETDRKYIGFEIDEQYYEIAKKRLNGITADGQLSIFTDIDKLNEELIKCQHINQKLK
jgi:DNA modification methylase